jgi:hypothetical protein
MSELTPGVEFAAGKKKSFRTVTVERIFPFGRRQAAPVSGGR